MDLSFIHVEFLKTGEVDLGFVTEDDILVRINNIKNALSANADKKDIKYIELYKEFKKIIKKFKNDTKTSKETEQVVKEMDLLLNKIYILNNENSQLTRRYTGDESCMRIHKRLVKDYNEHLDESEIYEVMNEIIYQIDDILCHLPDPTEAVIMREMLRPVKRAFLKFNHKLSVSQIENVIYYFIDDKFGKEGSNANSRVLVEV